MKFFIWSDFDLDGTGSILVCKWAFPGVDIAFRNTKVKDFKKDFTHWLTTDSVSNYDKVFILDLDVSGSAELVDHSNVVIIDHHVTHLENVGVYKQCTRFIEEGPSCCLLLYKLFQSKLNRLKNSQKRLIVYVNDYDSYKLEHKESTMLNFLFSDMDKGTYGNKVERFISEFNDGFNGFNQFQLNIISLHLSKVNRAINNSQYFEGELTIQGKQRGVKAAITDIAINEVCDSIINDGFDIAIAFNPKTQSVSFRTAEEDLDVSKIAALLCDGGGHKYAAGGKVTDKFIEFTKLLKQTE